VAGRPGGHGAALLLLRGTQRPDQAVRRRGATTWWPARDAPDRGRAGRPRREDETEVVPVLTTSAW